MDRNIPEIEGKGIYCLILRNTACSINVGRCGKIDFEAGYHIYVGSALGPGGLKRLNRHIRVAQNGKISRAHWHIDYLLTHPAFDLVSVIYAHSSERMECLLAERIGAENVPVFGCSDCNCRSHLFYRRSSPLKEIGEAFLYIFSAVPVTIENF